MGGAEEFGVQRCVWVEEVGLSVDEPSDDFLGVGGAFGGGWGGGEGEGFIEAVREG